MWQIRLFGKADYYDDTSSQAYIDDTRDQWTPLYAFDGKQLYNDVDKFTVKCQTRFKTNDNVLIAYSDTILVFGYINRATTIVYGAQYEYEVVEYLNALTKYPVPRAGVTSYKQISEKTLSMRSRVDNLSVPGGKKTLKQYLDVLLVGAGQKWSHTVDDYYYNNSFKKCDLDVMGPYYRWGRGNIGSRTDPDFDILRWYDIPNFTQVPGAYGQLPTSPNTEMKIGSTSIITEIDEDDKDELLGQVCQIPWLPDELETDPVNALKTFRDSLINFIPTIELCATTVYGGIQRLLLDLFKMNVWVEAKYKKGDFPLDTPDSGEYIKDVTFVLKYGYVRDQKVTQELQYNQIRIDDTAVDSDMECVMVIGKDPTLDVGMAVRPSATVPYKTVIYDYSDGRNTQELDALAKQILHDYSQSYIRIEVDLSPGIPYFDGDQQINVGDIIRIKHEQIKENNTANGWYDGADSSKRYYKRMSELNSWGYLSGEYDDMLYTVKAIRFSISATTLELENTKGDIFSIMGDRLRRRAGTSQEYEIDHWTPMKSDISFRGRSKFLAGTELPYTNVDPAIADYGEIIITDKLPDTPTGVTITPKTWDGTKFVDATEYMTDNYPAWTSMWLYIPKEDSTLTFPDDRGIVPISYIGPWFNLEIKLKGSRPNLNPHLYGDVDSNSPIPGTAWVIPFEYDIEDAKSYWSTKDTLDAKEIKDEYTRPGTKSKIPQAWIDAMYFTGETDLTLDPDLINTYFPSTGQTGVGNMNYLRIGPIPKGFTTATISTNISFIDAIYGYITGTLASYQGSLTFNFQWSLDRKQRPKNTTFNSASRIHTIQNPWDSSPECQYGGNWTSAQVSPSWSVGPGTRIATIHSGVSLTNKTIPNAITDLYLYLRYCVILNFIYSSHGTDTYSFANCAGWEVSVYLTPGYELLDEWYKMTQHKIQLLIDGTGKWNNNAEAQASFIIENDMFNYMTDDGYISIDIRKFIGEGDNYIRIRSINDLSPGMYAGCQAIIRASYISGWLK